MSVINQMLKDLEQRQEQMQPGRYQPPAPARPIGWRALPLLGLPLLAYCVFWAWPLLFPVESVTHHGSAPMTQVVQTAVPLGSSNVGTSAAYAQVPQFVRGEPTAAVVPLRQPVSAALPTSAANAVSSAETANVTLSVAKTDTGNRAAPHADELAEASEDELLGPDLYAERQGRDAASAPLNAESQSSLEIEEVQLSAAQVAALERRKANQAIAKGDLAQARQSLFLVLQQEPQDHGTRERLAGLLYGEARLQEARSLLEQGVALAPRYADFRLLLARITLAMGDKPGALTYLASLEPDVSRNLDYYATRAALAQELGQHAVAVASYQQLSQVQPSEGRWWLGLAIAYDKQGRQLAAKDAYLRAQRASGLSAAALNFAQQRGNQLERGS